MRITLSLQAATYWLILASVTAVGAQTSTSSRSFDNGETVVVDFGVAQRSYAVTNFFDGPGMSVHAAASAGLNLHSMWASARAWFAENRLQPGYQPGNRLFLYLSCDWGYQDEMCQPPFGTGQGCEADCFGSLCGQLQSTPCPSEDPTRWHAHLDDWIAAVSASRTDWKNIVIVGWGEPDETYNPLSCTISDTDCRAGELAKAWRDTLAYVRNKLPGSGVKFAMPPVSSYLATDFLVAFLDAIGSDPTVWPDYATVNDNATTPPNWGWDMDLMKSLLDSRGITVEGLIIAEYAAGPEDPDITLDQLHWAGGTVHHFAKLERAFDRYFPGMDNSATRGCWDEAGMHTRTGRIIDELSNCVNGSITALLMDQWGDSGPWRQGAARSSYYAFQGYQHIRGPHVQVASSSGDDGVVDGVAGTDSITSARIMLGVTEDAPPTTLTLTLANVPSAFLSGGNTCVRYLQIPNRRSAPALVPDPITTLIATSMDLAVNAGDVLIMQLAKPTSSGTCTDASFTDF